MIDESSGGNLLGEWVEVQDQGTGAEAFTVELSEPSTPDTGTRTVTVFASDDTGMYITLTITLKEGGVSKGSDSFDSLSADDADPTECSFNVTSSISDYSDLTLTFSSDDGMSMGTSTKIFDAYFAVPDAAAAEITDTQSFSLVPGGAMGTSFSLIGDIDAPPKVRI
jgi:hypothetical protein